VADGGWVCKGEADLYSRNHAWLAAVAALMVAALAEGRERGEDAGEVRLRARVHDVAEEEGGVEAHAQGEGALPRGRPSRARGAARAARLLVRPRRARGATRDGIGENRFSLHGTER
jgi:hypothetical protein